MKKKNTYGNDFGYVLAVFACLIEFFGIILIVLLGIGGFPLTDSSFASFSKDYYPLFAASLPFLIPSLICLIIGLAKKSALIKKVSFLFLCLCAISFGAYLMASLFLHNQNALFFNVIAKSLSSGSSFFDAILSCYEIVDSEYFALASIEAFSALFLVIGMLFGLGGKRLPSILFTIIGALIGIADSFFYIYAVFSYLGGANVLLSARNLLLGVFPALLGLCSFIHLFAFSGKEEKDEDVTTLAI